jgi:hypothetical protein
MTAGNRNRLGTVALVATAIGAVAAGAVVSRRLLRPAAGQGGLAGARVGGEKSALAAAIPTSTDGAGTFQVATATGKVSVQRAGVWQAVHPGDTLARTDVVRTAAGSGAVLRLSAGTEIELRAGVEIALDQLPGGASVDLRRGKVFARVSTASALAITSHETRTANADGPARFVVLADEHGRVSVAALEGNASFTAAGKTVKLPAGTVSSSRAGGPPDDPEHVSEDVLLSVVWPTMEAHKDHADIKGRASPSSVVTVHAATATQTATVGDDGAFAVTIPVSDAKTPVQVEAEDLVGNTRRASTTLSRRQASAPVLKPEATDLWKPRPAAGQPAE